ncbi:MAG: pyridoxamine 5'-phosphate oxidase family protein [Treponema sp.]|nr:pyridoxamine 5'-phosphate oxidase family protein [Treponema sp.]
MRRKDREINDPHEILAIIARCKVCRLALSDDGAPYIVPLNFGYTCESDTLRLYFHSAAGGRKLDILKRNNRACFEVDCDHGLIEADRACGYGFAFSSVIVSGTLEILETDEEKIRGLNALMKHQTGGDTAFSYGEADLRSVTVLQMTAAGFTGKVKKF